MKKSDLDIKMLIYSWNLDIASDKLMHFQHRFLFLWTLTSIAVLGALCDDSLIFHPNVKDPGYATNCGKEPFNMSWTPKVLSPRGSIDITVDYTTPYDMNGGTYNASIYFHGDQTPLLVYANPFTCDDVKSVLPCPMKKGVSIKKTFTISQTKYLISFPGRYTVIAQVKNEKSQEMFCANLDVTVGRE